MSMRNIDRFQQIIVIILTWLMAFVVLVATVDLVYVLARDLILPPIGLQIGESLNFFGSSLNCVGEIGHKISPLCLCVSVVQLANHVSVQSHEDKRDFAIQVHPY